MSTEKYFKAVIPDGTHFDESRGTPGAHRATARDDLTNKLVAHAELYEVDPAEFSTNALGESDASTGSELGGALVGLALIGLTVGAAAAAAAVSGRRSRRRDTAERVVETATNAEAGWYDVGLSRQRWWDGQRWTEQFRADPNYAPAPAGWYDDGAGRQRWWDGTRWTDHFQAAQVMARVESYAVTDPAMPATAQDAAVLPGLPHLTMSSAEWQERMRAMLLARAISDRQWRLLSAARIVDAEPELLEWQHQLAGLTSQQFADQLHLAVEADPALAREASRRAVAGWYDDGSGLDRWWDGHQWTEHRQLDALPSATGIPQAVPAGWYDDGSGRQRYWDGHIWR